MCSAAEITVPARGKTLVPTDFSLGIPQGTHARIVPGTGRALRKSTDVGAWLIDPDCRGPVGVLVSNHSDADLEVKRGYRIAQLILQKIVTPEVLEVEEMEPLVLLVFGRVVSLMGLFIKHVVS